MIKTAMHLLNDAKRNRHKDVFAFFPYEAPLNINDMWDYSISLSSLLLEKGIMKKSRVIVKGNNTRDFILAVFACWFCGAIVLPVEEAIDEKRFENLLDQFKAEYVIHTLVKEIFDIKNSRTDLLWDGSNVFKNIDSVHNIAAKDGALCIYTSGSTGEPKGVLLSHEALFNGAINVIDAFKIDNTDVGFCVLPMTHINGLVTTFLAPLVSGGKVIYYQGIFEVDKVIDQIDSKGCTWMSAIPMHYNMMANSNMKNKLNLKFCRSAAAPLPINTLRKFEEKFRVPLIETMGMTETAGQIFANPLPPGIRKPGSVGKPVNYNAKVVDDDGNDLSTDIVGELLIKGNSMMTNYIDDPLATGDAYIDVWFKTGDLAKMDEDGYIYIEGRKKHMAIFAGVNIPLGGIEKVLINIEEISDAVCIPRDNILFGEVVETYVLLKKPVKRNVDYFINIIKKTMKPFLPSMQALGEIFIVNNLPITGVGKVDRQKIKNVIVNHSDVFVKFKKAVDILKYVLDNKDLQIDEDARIGDLPGWDSLAQVKILHVIELIIKRSMSLDEINESKSLIGIQRLLDGLEANSIKDRKNSLSETAKCHDILGKMNDLGFGTTDIMHLIMSYEYLRNEGVNDVAVFVRTLLDICPENTNIVLNGFNWDYCKGVSFSRRNTPCQTGLINECFRVSERVARGNHPIYSYLAYGSKAEEIVEHASDTCWGEGSATMRLLKHPSVLVLCGGVPFPFRNPIMHALEEMFKVDYRYFKLFTGWVDMNDGLEWYQTNMYVRDLELNCKSDWFELGKILKREKLLYGKENKLFSYNSKDVLKWGIEILKNNKEAFCGFY